MLHTELSQRPQDNKIREGDLVVVYERFDSLKAVRVNSRSEFSNKFGHFKMQVCTFCRFGFGFGLRS